MDDVSAQLERARMLLDIGREEQAVAAYEDVLAADPHNVPALLGLASSLLTSEPTRARDLAHSALALEPESAQACIVAALASNKCGEKATAIRLAYQAVKLRPSSSFTQQTLSNVLIMSEDTRHLPAALSASREAVRLDPNDANSWLALGNVQLLLNNVPAAEQAFDEALRLDPLNTSTRRVKAALETDDGQLASAMSMLQSLMVEDPTDSRSKERFDSVMDQIIQDVVWASLAIGLVLSIVVLAITGSP